ncbi:tRNA (adenosine(37)-N6)-dimethylallyltransferase MiaA [Weeksellaceae bacterium TAE3-ERU29]|nr:tRNA (adenosine(37)-N6)-dimethylallyltransferase MiaA [Weeksellaceae bacterium TAE3-ERU29]
MQKYLIVIVGPTAIGKTATAIEVAKAFNTEIISSDSRQFFKEMTIGTAVPDTEELAQIPHHFIQHISILQEYSVGDFEREALSFINNYFKTNDVLVMAGGSGLYERAVTEGLDYFPDVPGNIRETLNSELEEKGIETLQQELKEKDLEYYKKVDLNNPHRVIRALEIIRHTEKPYSFYLNRPKEKREFNIIKIGLHNDREIIYNRINKRVDLMMQNGLLQEAENLYKYRNLNALNTVGYKELFEYFDENISLEEAIEEIKKNTRRFAKRQLTWYRKDQSIKWFNPTKTYEIIDFLKKEINI